MSRWVNLQRWVSFLIIAHRRSRLELSRRCVAAMVKAGSYLISCCIAKTETVTLLVVGSQTPFYVEKAAANSGHPSYKLCSTTVLYNISNALDTNVLFIKQDEVFSLSVQYLYSFLTVTSLLRWLIWYPTVHFVRDDFYCIVVCYDSTILTSFHSGNVLAY